MTYVSEEQCRALRDNLAIKLDALTVLMRREFDLLAEDRERQQHDLSERLDGMNAIRAQLEKQAATFVTRERVEALERTTWRALSILIGIVLAIQIIGLVLIKGV